jgi:hypothetical protein
LKSDSTRAETRIPLSVKRRSPFKSVGASVQSTTGSRGVRISGSNAGYTVFRGSVKGTGYPLHSPVSLSLPLPCVTVCHHISTGVNYVFRRNFHPHGTSPMYFKTYTNKTDLYGDNTYQMCRLYKYMIYVHLMVLIDFVNQCTSHGMNNIETEW